MDEFPSVVRWNCRLPTGYFSTYCSSFRIVANVRTWNASICNGLFLFCKLYIKTSIVKHNLSQSIIHDSLEKSTENISGQQDNECLLEIWQFLIQSVKRTILKFKTFIIWPHILQKIFYSFVMMLSTVWCNFGFSMNILFQLENERRRRPKMRRKIRFRIDRNRN